MFRKRRRFGVAAGKGADEARKLRLRKIRGKVNAGDAGTGEQLGKTFFASGRAERHAVEQDLHSGCAEQKSAAAALIERTTQFFPRGFKLRRRPHVAKFI